MKPVRQTLLIGALVAASVSMLGCGPEQPAKEIAPGQFVVDEPIQLTRGPLEKSSKCIVDTINGKVASKELTWEIHRGEEAVFLGWAFSKDGAQATAPLFIRLTGDVQTYYAVTSTRKSRLDVNQYFHIDPALMAGYELRAKTDQIEPGVYAITTIQPFASTIEGCESHAMLIVN